MQKEIKALVEILKYFNGLIKQQALPAVQISLATSLEGTISYFENKTVQLLLAIEACDTKNYEQQANLLAELHFILRQYALDIERFGTLWFEMWSTYHKFASVENEFINIKFDKLPEDILMYNNFQRVLKIIIRLNKLDNKKIVYKKELDALTAEISQLPSINEKLRIFINTVIHRDKTATESATGYFIYIGGKIGDYLCFLERINQTLLKILHVYSDKKDMMADRNEF